MKAMAAGMLIRWCSRMALRTAMVEVAAAADGLLALRLDVGRAAHGVDQNLFDQPGAGTTGTGGLGVLFTSSTENSPCSGSP